LFLVEINNFPKHTWENGVKITNCTAADALEIVGSKNIRNLKISLFFSKLLTIFQLSEEVFSVFSRQIAKFAKSF
jgi:hypothetical protein